MFNDFPESLLDNAELASVARRINAPTVVDFPGAHLGLKWRAITVEDVPLVCTLFSKCAGEQLTGEKLSVKELNGLANLSRFATLSGWDQEENLQAFAFVAVNEDAYTELQADIFAVVYPQWRGRGIGRSMLEWQDGTARLLIGQDGRDLPVAIRSHVNATNLDRRRLLAAGGFSPSHYKTLVVHKVVPEDIAKGQAAQARLAERGLVLAPFSSKYSEALRRLHNRLTMVKERSQPMSLQNWLKYVEQISTDNSYLLFNGNDIIAYVITVDTGEPEVHFVRNYGVERGMRRQGIGSDLILSLLVDASEQGKEVLQVPVVTEGVPQKTFLSRFDFLEDQSQILYTIDL